MRTMAGTVIGRRPLGVLVLRVDPETYLYPYLSRWPTLREVA